MAAAGTRTLDYRPFGFRFRGEDLQFFSKMLIITLISAAALPFGAFGLEPGSSLILRSSIPTDMPFSYTSMYMAAKLRLVLSEGINLHLTLKKGSGEPGYYPGGYFGDSDTGLYEQGSWYLHLEERLGLNQLIVGNYYPLFGQGLLYGGSFPLLLYAPYYDLARYRDGIYPTTTTAKAVLMEGVAGEVQIKGLLVRPFVSWNSYDCTAGESDYYLYNDNDWDGIANEDDPDDFDGADPAFPDGYSCKNDLSSAIRDDADYGTDSDRAKRNNLTEYCAGINVSTSLRDLALGWTLSYTLYNRLVDPYYNFDPAEGDKTSYLFRGKDYLSSSLYFKRYGRIEVFGELAGTMYRSLSYYPEFNRSQVSAVGMAGGMRARLGETGVILWGAYIPASLVNPHGQEYPEGLNNYAGGLAGIHRSTKGKRVSAWLFGYRELVSPDGDGSNEAGLSYGQRMQLRFGNGHELSLRQELDVTDHHYYEPDDVSVAVVSEAAPRLELNDHLDFRLELETRLGGPIGGTFHAGAGLTPEVLLETERDRGSLGATLFATGSSRFASVYPYRRSLHSWSFTSRELNGTGTSAAVTWVRKLPGSGLYGVKVSADFFFGEPSRNGATIYLTSRIPL